MKTNTTLLRQAAFLRQRDRTLFLMRPRHGRCCRHVFLEGMQTRASANRSASLVISRMRRAGAYHPPGGARVRGEP